MRNTLILFILTAFFICLSAVSYAGEVTYTGRATIIKDDIRSAQKNSLNNALLGGIKQYIKSNSPGHKGDITADYFVFIKNYTILERKLNGNSVQTKVKIELDDTITDEVAVFVTGQVNTALFYVKGLSEYIKLNDIRKDLSDIFYEMQFSTNEQVAFEQEIIDPDKNDDILTAFQSVSSQYLFNFTFNVKDYKAGESCTVVSDSYYISINNITKRVPVIRSEVTVEDEDMVNCMKSAVYASVENSLMQVREKLIAAPGEKIQEYTYNIRFEGVEDLRAINEVIDTLQKRKLIAGYEMTEMYGTEAVFSVKSYFLPSDLMKRIGQLNMPEIADIASGDYNEAIILDMNGKR